MRTYEGAEGNGRTIKIKVLSVRRIPVSKFPFEVDLKERHSIPKV